MGQCNFCSLNSIKSKAKRREQTVKKMPATWGMGGLDIFIVPKHIKLVEIRTWKQPSDDLPNGDVNWERYHVAWFMELSDSCCC